MVFLKIFARLKIWASYLAMVCAGFVCFLFFRFPFNFTSVRGRKNIPRRGERVLFLSNHTTMYDSFLIGVAAFFPKHIFYPSLPFINFAARENFFRTWFSKALFALLRTVPVERRDHPWLMRKYVELLERHNLLIFYQGTRSDDLTVVKNGPAFAIAHTPFPITVIPVYHNGLERIFSRGGPQTRGRLALAAPQHAAPPGRHLRPAYRFFGMLPHPRHAATHRRHQSAHRLQHGVASVARRVRGVKAPRTGTRR